MIDDLAVGHAGALVEIDDAGLGVGSDLALGGADRVGGLQRMTAAHASPAILAAALVDAELSAPGSRAIVFPTGSRIPSWKPDQLRRPAKSQQ